MQAEPEAEAVRALFRDVIPALLGHRLAPLALCNATVVSEFRRLASRLRLLDDSVVPRALLAGRAGAKFAVRHAKVMVYALWQSMDLGGENRHERQSQQHLCYHETVIPSLAVWVFG